MPWEIVLGGGALVISILSWLTSLRTAQRQTQLQQDHRALQERLVVIEEVRERDRVAELSSANLVARMTRRPRKDRVVIVSNHGPAEARNVKVTLDGVPIDQVAPKLPGSVHPVPRMSPGAEATFPLMVTMGSPSTYQARVEWDDRSGPGHWEGPI